MNILNATAPREMSEPVFQIRIGQDPKLFGTQNVLKSEIIIIITHAILENLSS